jgi:uncharacterized protein
MAAYARGDYVTALQLFRPLGERSVAPAQFFLGVLYASGQGVKQNYAEAAKWYRRAADQGNAFAQDNLGLMYDRGLGVKQNSAEAAKWFRKAADQGYDGGQDHLGTLYIKGRGVKRNYGEATKWFRKAAEQGNADAQFSLGLIYHQGQGVLQNYADAAKWMRRAADQGYALPQFFVGGMYVEGEGVPQDYVQAHMWLNLAASQGNHDAAKERDRIASKMTPLQIEKAQRLAAEWRPKKQEVGAAPPPAAEEPPASVAGTGFFLTRDGDALTAAHVVEGCSQPRLEVAGEAVSARIVARDKQNDLALLKADMRPANIAHLRLSVRQGEEVAVFGFPLAGLLASGGNITSGNVTALAGMSDDSRFLQISAPVQQGNSGGPLLDQSGNVIGIVVSKLDALKVASITEDIPQNVHFAIKASVVADFLEANNVAIEGGEIGGRLSAADIAERAKAFTVGVECSR